jgi:hypothetical protein
MDATGLDAVERLQLTGQDSPSILVALSKYGKIIDVHLDQCEICDDDAAIMGKMLSEHSLSSFALTNSTVSRSLQYFASISSANYQYLTITQHMR